MSTGYYLQVIFKNLLISIVAFLLIELVVEDVFRQSVQYNPIFEYSVIFGALVGFAAGINELLVENSIRRLARDNNIVLNKVNLTVLPAHYSRLFRVFVVSSMICFLLILLSFNASPLHTFVQLSVIPVCLALGANVPQTYTMRISLNGNRQEVLSVIQQTLYDSVFELEFRDHHHLVYRIENRWRRLYTYCAAPDRCSMEVVIFKDYVELTGSYKYLKAFLNDKYIRLVTKKEEDKSA